jgi:hypothetical protein
MKVFRVVCMFFYIILCSCTDRNDELAFLQNVHSKLPSSGLLETDFVSFTDYKWEKICFGYAPNAELSFYDKNSNLIRDLTFSRDEAYINEDYVDGSPSKKCFKSSQIFILETVTVLGEKTVLIKQKSI